MRRSLSNASSKRKANHPVIDRVNVMPLTERQNEDEAQAAIIQIDEVLTLLQELGDVARRARMNLVAPRHRGARGVPAQSAVAGAPRTPLRTEDAPAGETGARDTRPDAAQQPLPLTRRQKEVLHLLAQGLSNRRIGRALHITEQTVKAHLHMVYHKLGVADRTEAVVIALRQGLVQHQRREDPPS
ncbi:response regulator transcription factor [Streptomyces sp. SID14515]|uniref:helix-turn-helix transcriptional regulator n=1 Tax=Streptomyces sp. SID14515 TaxID=2706074 RepID=UPI0031BB742D